MKFVQVSSASEDLDLAWVFLEITLCQLPTAKAVGLSLALQPECFKNRVLVAVSETLTLCARFFAAKPGGH